MQRRRSRQEQFEDACERLERYLDTENPNFLLSRATVGTVFLLMEFDKERAQNLLKAVYFKWNREEPRFVERSIERTESHQER